GPQALGRCARDRRANHLVALALPRVRRRSDHDALSCPCLADEHGDPSVARDRVQRLTLLGAQRRADLAAGLEAGLADRLFTDGGRPLRAARFGECEGCALALAQLARRPAAALQSDELSGARERGADVVRLARV